MLGCPSQRKVKAQAVDFDFREGCEVHGDHTVEREEGHLFWAEQSGTGKICFSVPR